MTTAFPFPVDPVLTGIVIAYRNADLIADRVLPRIGPALTKRLFKYNKFDFAQGIKLQNTRVGRKGVPDEIELTMTEVPAEVADYALGATVPQDDIQNAPPGTDPLAYHAQALINLVDLGREARVASLVFNAATYPAGNSEALTGSDKWSDPDSDPLGQIQDAMDAMVMRANVVVLGRASWSILRRHPQIVGALSRSGTERGRATAPEVADLLEVSEIIVGDAWVDRTRQGQTASRTRAWGPHAALLRREPLAKSINQMPTFGWTAEYLTRISGATPDTKSGLRGAQYVKSGESLAEVIAAPDLGYFFQDVV